MPSTPSSQRNHSGTSKTKAMTAHGPYSGWIDNTYDALLVYEAASRGIIPRITRRLTANERALIGSGTIFVYDERESGIKRWTDGYTWSPSRALNNFFLYREVLNRTPNTPNKLNQQGGIRDDAEVSGDEQCCYSEEVKIAFERDRNLEKTLVGSLRNSYPFKVGGMMKKTISFCVKGLVSHHIVSYYTLEDVIAGRLIKVSEIPEIRNLVPGAVYMDNLDVLNFPPKTIKTENGIIRYVGEADDIDKSRAGRPKDHPHVRAEEKAREHNFTFEIEELSSRRDRGDPSMSPVTYSRYNPYGRRKSGSSSANSGEDELSQHMSMYYYHRGPAPSRRPGAAHSNGYSSYPYPYDPYGAYHHWYAQQAAYYPPYAPSAPYGYAYSYPPYYSEPHYARRRSQGTRSPSSDSVKEVEKPAERSRDTRLHVNGEAANRTDLQGEHPPAEEEDDIPMRSASEQRADLRMQREITADPESQSLSPLTPVADDDESD